MLTVNLTFELVESLINRGSAYTGTVLLMELKELMETSMSWGLMNGREVSLVRSFEEAWNELVVDDALHDDEFSSDSGL